MPKKPNIYTEHGHIRLLTEADSAELSDFYRRNQTHLKPWEPIRTEDFYSHESMLNRILEAEGDFHADRLVKLGVFCPHQPGHMIASITFSQIVRGPMQACFVGYSIDAQKQGQGLMLEFMPECLRYMFNEFDIHRIAATHMTNNTRSAALLERLGFEKEGYAKSYLNIGDGWQDHILTALVNPAH